MHLSFCDPQLVLKNALALLAVLAFKCMIGYRQFNTIFDFEVRIFEVAEENIAVAICGC